MNIQQKNWQIVILKKLNQKRLKKPRYSIQKSQHKKFQKFNQKFTNYSRNQILEQRKCLCFANMPCSKKQQKTNIKSEKSQQHSIGKSRNKNPKKISQII